MLDVGCWRLESARARSHLGAKSTSTDATCKAKRLNSRNLWISCASAVDSCGNRRSLTAGRENCPQGCTGNHQHFLSFSTDASRGTENTTEGSEMQVKDPTASSQKWSTRANGASNDYGNGVANTQADQAGLAAAAAAVWAQAVAQAAASGSFAKNVL